MKGWKHLRSWALVGGLVLFLGGCGSSTGDEGSGQTEDASSKSSAGGNDSGDETSDAKSKSTKSDESKASRVKRYAVLEVVDGDTVHVAYRGDTTIRVIGIDTPETVHPSKPVECGGPKASKTAHRLLDGEKVRLVFDRSQGRKDKYGRTLAYLQIPGIGDYGLKMIKKGRAAEYTYDTAYKRQSRYQNAEDDAQTADRGLWGKCGGPHVAPEPNAPATEEPPDEPSGNCAPDYDPCVPSYPPDVNCEDVDGPIMVTGDDPHGLDRDGDGVACEP